MSLEYRAQSSKLPFREGVDIPFPKTREVYRNLITLGRNIFRDSAFVQGGEVGTQDLTLIYTFFGEVAKTHNPVFNESTQQTNILAGRYCRLLGERFNEIGHAFNLDELEALGLLHDFGRTMSHRRRINDLYGRSMMRQMGFRKEFLELFPNDSKWFPVIENGEINPEATRKKYVDITAYTKTHPTQVIVELADVLGKIDYERGRIIRWSEVIDKAIVSRQKLPERADMWGGEYLKQAGVVAQMADVIEFYVRLGRWAEDNLNVPLEELVNEMTQRLRVKRIEKFYAKEEKKYTFDVVIFDIGGVLIKGGSVLSNEPIVDNVARRFKLTTPEERQKLGIKLEEIIKKMQIGEDIKSLEKQLALEFGNNQQISLDEAITEVEQGMEADQEVISIAKGLIKNGVRVIFASNTVTCSMAKMAELLRAGGLKLEIVNITSDIRAVREECRRIESRGSIPVFTSYQLRARKGEQTSNGSGFFECIKLFADLAGSEILEGRDVVTVDDKPDYAQEAEQSGFKAHTFNTTSEFELFLNSQVP